MHLYLIPVLYPAFNSSIWVPQLLWRCLHMCSAQSKAARHVCCDPAIMVKLLGGSKANFSWRENVYGAEHIDRLWSETETQVGGLSTGRNRLYSVGNRELLKRKRNDLHHSQGTQSGKVHLFCVVLPSIQRSVRSLTQRRSQPPPR